MNTAFALGAKLVVVGGLVAVGVGAATLAPTVPVASAAPAVWIDAPATSTLLPVGPVSVEAHATGTSGDSAVLEVDGHLVHRASATTQTGTLTFLTFDWTATVGAHQLVVGVDGLRSAPRTVLVFAIAAPTSTAPVVLPTLHTPPKTSGSHPSVTPSSATPSSATPVSTPTSGHSTPSSHPVPSTSAPRSTPTPPRTSTSSSPPTPTVGVPAASNEISWCSGTATITVTASGATAVTIRVSPGGPTLTATRSGDVWSAQVSVDELPQGDFDQRDEYSLVATATGPGGAATSAAGTLTMQNCKP